MARHTPWIAVLALLALAARAALALIPSEYLYGTAQSSNFAITSPAYSIDGDFNGLLATVAGWTVDTPPNQLGHWTFTVVQDTASTGVAGAVAEVRFSQSGWVDDAFAFEVFDGVAWTRLTTFSAANPPPSSLTTLSYDVGAVLSTIASVNAAQLRLIGVAKSGARDSIALSVDGVRLGIEGPPVPTPTATSTPTSETVGTPTGTATSATTPPQTSTSTATIPPTETATSTSAPTGTPTPTSTPTEVPPSGTTNITPEGWQNASPGATVSYTHTVTHLGPSFDTKDIAAISSQGWGIGLFGSDGVTPLGDTNGNGVPDTGQLTSGQSRTIVVTVNVPPNGLAGVQDVMTITATSARNPNPSNSDWVTDTTTVNRVLTMRLSMTAVSFGFVSPDGEIDSEVIGVSSSTDDLGAYYINTGLSGQGSLTATVSSNGPWTGACWAEENSGSATTISIGVGKFEWSPAGMGLWTPFTADIQTVPYDNSCFANRALYTNTYGYDFRLRVDWADSPGTFSSNVVLVASQ